MPTGKFVADFDSFYSAVQKADTQLVGFEGNANKVGASLTRMTDTFSGTKVIQNATLMSEAIDRIGGVSKLTEAELARVSAQAQDAVAKMNALGTEVPPKLQALADATKQTGTAFQQSFNNFNIKEAISDPLGTAGTSMTAFAESIGPVGIAVAGLSAGSLAVGAALLGLTEQAAAVGGKLNDVGEVTGIAVPALSRLSNASTVAGTDISTLSNAVFMMQKNMGESPDKFERGLERIKINFADFKALSPDEQLLAIASALKATEDPVQRNTAGFETMGRQFRDIEPALLKLNDALARTADIQPWTDEQAKQAEAFEMQLTSLKVHAEALGLSLGRDLILPIAEVVAAFTSAAKAAADFAGGFGGILTPVFLVREGFNDLNAAIDVFLGKSDELPKATGNAAKGLAAIQENLKDLQINVPKLTDALLAQSEVVRDLDPSTKKLIDAYTEINAAGIGWQGTLDKLDGSVVEAIKFYLQAGVSQKALADAYGLSAVSIKAIDSSLKDTLASEKTLDEFRHLAHNRQVEIIRIQTDQQNKLKDAVNAAILAEFDAQTKLNKAWGLDAAGAIQVQSSALDTLNQKMAALHLVKVEGLSQQNEEALLIKDYTDALLREAQAQDVATEAADKGNKVRAETIDGLHRLSAASASATIPAGATNPFPDTVEGRLAQLAATQARNPGVAINLAGLFAGLPTYADGGPIGASGPAMVHGGEYVVPQGGALVMAGGGSSRPLTINLVLDGRVVATVVNDINSQDARQDRLWPSR